MTVVTDQSFTRFLAITHDTDVDVWRARIEAKRVTARYFRDLEEAAKKPAHVQPTTRRIKSDMAAARAAQAAKYEPHIAPCTGCGTLTRPGRSTAAETAHPDLPPRRAYGMCAPCFNQARRKPDTRPKVRTCDTCGWPTRPSRSPISEYPGTRARQTETTCGACYKRARRNAA